MVEYGTGDQDDQSVTVFYGPGQVQNYKKSLEFYGKKKLFFSGTGSRYHCEVLSSEQLCLIFD